METAERILGFLLEWAKAIRAYNLYPEGHPTLASLSGGLSRLFRELVEKGFSPLELEISRSGFKYGGQRISSASPAVFSLLNHLYQRRLNRISFLPSLDSEGIHEFLKIISLGETEIRSLGGVKAICEIRKLSGLEVSEVDFQEVLPDEDILRQEVQEELAPAQEFVPGPEPEPERDEWTKLQALLQDLEREDNPGRAGAILSEFLEVLQPLLGANRRVMVMEALGKLSELSTSPVITTDKRDFFSAGWGQVLTRPTLETLINWLANPPAIGLEPVWGILKAAGPGLLPSFLTMLLETPRSRLTGSPALKMLEAYPEDGILQILAEKIRSAPISQIISALFLMSTIGKEKAIPVLREQLARPESAVLREAISGLSLIGGRDAARVLMNYFFSAPAEQKPQVLAALGTMPPEEVFHFLTQILLGDSAPALRKSAMVALGTLKDRKAVPLLIKVLTQTSFFRKLPSELERQAAATLVEIGGEEALRFLAQSWPPRNFSDQDSLWEALGSWEKNIGLLDGS